MTLMTATNQVDVYSDPFRVATSTDFSFHRAVQRQALVWKCDRGRTCYFYISISPRGGMGMRVFLRAVYRTSLGSSRPAALHYSTEILVQWCHITMIIELASLPRR